MEAVLLTLVCLSPWAYGAVHPGFEFLLDVGIALLLVLWGLRMLLEGRLTWKKCPVAACLGGLFLIGTWQVAPLPRPVLARLAPATARLYEQLLPQQREALPGEEGQPAVNPPAGSTLSLYPAATRKELFRLLAVFLVFAAVRNNLLSGALTRLSVAALMNGALLSLLALAQFFSSSPGTLYWTEPSLGQVFGPFINRNHFPYYINMCIGLGVGLLVSRGVRDSRRGGPANALVRLLHDPPSLWLCAALGLLVGSVAVCRSRGGLVALAGAAVLCAVLGRLRLGSSSRLTAGLLVGAVAAALCGWFGFGLIKERLDTFWNGNALEDRLPLWSWSLPIAGDFPLWGTGYGTYGCVEPMYRTGVHTEGPILYDHAHNDYLEVLVEGGVPALGLVVLTIGVVYGLGYRAISRNKGRPAAGLALGGLFAFTTFVLHSFGDFGAHVPAIALLATTITAHLASLGRPASADGSDEHRLRLGGIAPLAGALTVITLGLMLCAHGWKAHRIDRLQEAAARTGGEDADHLRKRITYLAAAAALAPDDASAAYEAGHARACLFQRLCGGRQPDKRMQAELLLPLLRDYRRARDACPLLPEAHLGLGICADKLGHGDGQAAYFRRVKLLAPVNPELWYFCGQEEVKAKRLNDAWASWRHSLELSDAYLLPILARSAKRLSPAELIDKVLPDSPDVLLAAALRLYPDPEGADQRRPFLEKALRLLESKPEGREPRELHVQALVYKGLDDPKAATAAYRDLLHRQPGEVPWRYEFACYLRDLHDLEECRRELTIVLAQDPRHGAARQLLDTVTKELLQEKWGERR